MITRAMLLRWREAITLSINSLTTEPEIPIAMQEMYIEAKWLRRDNLLLLNSEDLIELMANFLRLSVTDHYLTEDMIDLLEEVDCLAKRMKIDLELNL